MKKMISIYILALSALLLSACGGETQMVAAAELGPLATSLSAQAVNAPYTADTPIISFPFRPFHGPCACAGPAA